MRARGREIYIIAGVVAVVLIIAWYFLLFSPQRQKMSDLGDQITAQQTALSTAQQEVARLESYKKTAPQSRAEIVRLGKMLPQAEGIPSLIIELTRTSDASGVDLNSITRGATTPGTPFGIQTVTLAVTGRFFDIEDFVYRLESYVAFRNASFRVTGRLLEIQNLTMSGGGTATTDGSVPPLTVSVALNAYLWAGAPAGSAGGAQ
jgi:Tfp pilus assembly protein PilO